MLSPVSQAPIPRSATLEQIEQMEKEFQANLFKHGILQTKLVVAAELVWGLPGAA